MKKPAANYADIDRAARARQHADRVRDLEAQIALRQARVEELEAALSVTGVLKHAAKHARHELVVKPTGGDRTQAAAVAVLSDIHAEESVDSRQVNGLNEYNLAIAERSITAFFRGVLRLTEIERGGVDIDELVLHLGGDMMSGYIHDDLVEANALSPTQTVAWLLPRLRDGIAGLRAHGNFKRISVVCNYGNHGRTTKKPRVSTGAANSYEWLLYQVLAQELSEGMQWQIADGYHAYADVLGTVVRFHHGDSIRYEGGIGGITIPVNKAIDSWNKGRRADLDVFGHWHTSLAGKNFVANGSVIGYGPYSLQVKAAYEVPSQTFFLIDAKRGRTAVWPIFVR